MRRLLTFCGGLVIGLVVALVAATSASADCLFDTSDSFALVNFGDIAVDDAHGQVFLTGQDIPNTQASGSSDPAVPSDSVVVRGFDGSAQKVIDDLPGASGLAVDEAHSVLYVALHRGNAIVAISTVTLTEIARYSTGDAQPLWLTMSGSVVWFDSASGMGAIDPGAASAGPPQLYSTGCPSGRIRSAATAPSVIVSMSDHEMCSTTVQGVAVLTVSRTTTDQLAQPFLPLPDGSEVIVGDELYSVPGFTDEGRFGGPEDTSHPGFVRALAMDDAGDVLVSRSTSDGGDVLVENRDAVTHRYVTGVGSYALAVSGDGTRVFFLTAGSGPGYSARLAILRYPLRPSSTVAVTGPAQVDEGSAVTLTGSASGGGAPLADTTLSVTRQDTSGTTTLPPVTTGSDGTFTVTDTPPLVGASTYCVSYDGGSRFRPACATAVVHVRADTQIVLRTPPQDGTPRDLSVTATIMSDGKPLANASLAVVEHLGNLNEILTFGTNTDANGMLTVPGGPPQGSDDPYTASFSVSYTGDAAHQPSSASTTDTAPRPGEATSVQVSTLPSNTTNTDLYGVLNSRSGVFDGTVSVSRTDAAGTHDLGSVTTAGNLHQFVIPRSEFVAGKNTFTFSFAGAGFRLPGTSSVTFTLPKTSSDISIFTNESNYPAGSVVHVIGHLGPTAAHRELSISATPRGGTPKVIAAGAVDDAGNLAVNYPITVATSFTARFAGDDATLPGTASTLISSSAVVRTAVAGFYGHDGGWVLFRHVSHPVFATTVVPAKAGQCVVLRTQRYSAGAWHPVGLSGCVRLDSASQGRLLPASTSYAVRTLYRVRFEWGADASNTVGYGDWQYVQFH